MSELARAMAPVLRSHDGKLDDLRYQLELHEIALDRSGAFSAMRLARERRAEQRQADSYLEGRGFDWTSRLTTAPGAARHETRAALDQTIKHMQRTRDHLAPGSSAFHKAAAEVRRLTSMASSS